MYCPKCGKFNIDGSTFCGYCGLLLKNIEKPITNNHTDSTKRNDDPNNNPPIIYQNTISDINNPSTTKSQKHNYSDNQDSPICQIQEGCSKSKSKIEPSIQQSEINDNTNSFNNEIHKKKNPIWIILTTIIPIIIGFLAWYHLPFNGRYINNIEFINDSVSDEFNQDNIETISVRQYSDEGVSANEKDTSILKKSVNDTQKETLFYGSVGDKYPIELMINGYMGNNGYIFNKIKYRYLKNNGDWIELIPSKVYTYQNAVSFSFKEYYGGKETGEWIGSYYTDQERISGSMTNSKGDIYSVSLTKENSPEKKNIKIQGAAITDNGNKYPFYITYEVNNGIISKAIYVNPNYSTKVNLTTAGIINGNYHFSGKLHGDDLIIEFSSNYPFKGTMQSGNTILNIQMDL